MEILLVGVADLTAVLITCVIGGICGYLAGQILKGSGLGLIPNVVVGIVGGVLFGYLFGSLSLIPDMKFVNEIIGGTIGAIVLLVIVGLFKK